MTEISPVISCPLRMFPLVAFIVLSGCRAENTPTEIVKTIHPTEEDIVILVPTPTYSQDSQRATSTQLAPIPSMTPAPPTQFPAVERTATSRLFSAYSMTNPLDRVAFASAEMGNLEIFVAPIGSGKAFQLTNNPAEDTHPALSPDGSTVAFASNRNGNFDLYLVDVENGALSQLTYDPAEDTQPAWSPDGSQIVFVSKRDGNYELYIIDVTCAQRENGCPDDLYRMTRSVYDDLVPDWSPDGQRIAFMTGRDGNLEIYHAKTNGLDIVRLTDNPGVDGFPTWSPDSSMIAFHSERDGNFDIYAKTINGNDEWRLTFDEDEDLAPDWFGDYILYMANSREKFNIAILQAPGILPRENSQRIWSTSRRTFVGYPSWGRLGGSGAASTAIEPIPTPHLVDIGVLPQQINIPDDQSIAAISWHPDGSMLVAGGYSALYFYEAPNMEFAGSVKLDLKMGANALDFSPDGKFLAIGHRDNRVRIWDPDTKQVLAILNGHHGDVVLVEYAPDGKSIASAGVQDDLYLWDLDHGTPLLSLYREELFTAQAVEFSPDGHLVAFGAGSVHLNIFDRQHFRFLDPLRPDYSSGYVSEIAISPDGEFIASGADHYSRHDHGLVEIWNLESRMKIANLEINVERVVGLEFTPDGSSLIGMTEDGQIYRWDTSNWELMAETNVGEFGRIHKAVLAPGGRWLSVATYHHIYFFDLDKILAAGK